MASNDMVGLRMSSDEVARLDAEARKRGLKRAALMRRCIEEALVDPYKIIEDASRGQFRASLVRYLLSLDDDMGSARRAIDELKLWLSENPFHPGAETRVKAAMSIVGGIIRDRMQEDLNMLAELASSNEFTEELRAISHESARRDFYDPGEENEEQ